MIYLKGCLLILGLWLLSLLCYCVIYAVCELIIEEIKSKFFKEKKKEYSNILVIDKSFYKYPEFSYEQLEEAMDDAKKLNEAFNKNLKYGQN